MERSTRRLVLLVAMGAALAAFPALALAGGSPSDEEGLKVQGLRGDTDVLGSNRSIDGYRFEVTSGSTAVRGGSVARPQFHPLRVKFSALAPGSPGLVQAVATNKQFTKAELDINAASHTCQPAGGERGCMRYCLYNVLVTEDTQAGNGNWETAEFAYTKIGLILNLQTGGGAVDTYSAGYDLNQGKTFTSTSC
jgi:type VI protein secretion system component Hcp